MCAVVVLEQRLGPSLGDMQMPGASAARYYGIQQVYSWQTTISLLFFSWCYGRGPHVPVQHRLVLHSSS
jgi:hypothetical protein